jgi:hypothetical protein
LSLIRFGHGSQLYIYEDFGGGFTCCDCPRDHANISLPGKEELKKHILVHKDMGHTIGLVGHPLTYQSYEELLKEIDDYEMTDG